MKSLALRLARPLLLLHLAIYKRDVRRAPFPVDVPASRIAGPDPDRLLFIGDLAVAGYGVLHHGMATASGTARLVARHRGRGCRWQTIASADLTAHNVARLRTLDVADVDVVVIMLGVPDVLLGTRTAEWAKNLRSIAHRVRAEAGAGCQIVFAAVPPMADFRPLPGLARRLLTLHTQRLNGAMRVVASETSNASYVPFPSWPAAERHEDEQICWKSMHKAVAAALAPVIVQRMRGSAPVL